jgi:OPA family sugar phosphate sensor protein UhpC-like MFS transporter
MMVLKNPIILALGFSCALMYVARYGFHSWGILYLQETKSYTLQQAGGLIGWNTIIGLCGAAFSGFFSDKFFKSRRNMPCLIFGIMLIFGLTMLRLTPPGHFWMDALYIGIFEFAIGGLIVFLGGLIAVDVMPKKAAGAVKGVIGLFSYLAVATQEWVSGRLIENTKTVVDGVTHYSFDHAFYFWIGSGVASMLLALIAWNIKPHE